MSTTDFSDSYLRDLYLKSVLTDEITWEWPNFNKIWGHKKYTEDGEPIPLLVRECNRLVPVKINETDYEFHPHNMPAFRFQTVEILGKIDCRDDRSDTVVFEVSDGTGIITVVWAKEEGKTQCQAVGDYIYVVGYLTIGDDDEDKDKEEQSWYRSGYSSLFIFAWEMKVLTDEEYNQMTIQLMEGFFKEKYTAE